MRYDPGVVPSVEFGERSDRSAFFSRHRFVFSRRLMFFLLLWKAFAQASRCENVNNERIGSSGCWQES